MIPAVLAMALLAAAAGPERTGAPRPLACPAGAEHAGAAPPDGTEEWCEARANDGTDAKRREGPARVYYDDGKLWIEESFAGGLRDGRFVERHRSGAKAREGAFAAGAKEGRWTIWSEAGAVEEESEWRRGVPDGRFVAYWPSGKRRVEGRHCGGVQCGRWSTYDEAGRLLGTVEYGEQTAKP